MKPKAVYSSLGTHGGAVRAELSPDRLGRRLRIQISAHLGHGWGIPTGSPPHSCVGLGGSCPELPWPRWEMETPRGPGSRSRS